MNQSDNLTPVASALQINTVVFDELSFHREGFENEGTNVQTNLDVTKQVIKLSDGKYRVIVLVTATRKDEYVENKDALLNSNAVAILFAYVRSQLTLLTAQPGTTPIVLPVVNIVKMIENFEETNNS